MYGVYVCCMAYEISACRGLRLQEVRGFGEEKCHVCGTTGKKLQRGTSAASVAAFLVRKRALHTQTVIALNCLHHCRCLPFDLLSDLVASTSTLSLFLAPVFFHSPRPLEIFAALTDFMRSKLFQFVPSRFKL